MWSIGCGWEEKYENLNDDMLRITGKNSQHRKMTMASAERTMKMAGWLDECTDGLPDVGSLNPIQLDIQQSGKAWRAAVLARKQEIIEERKKDLPTNTIKKKKTKNSSPDLVEVVDKAYIDRVV
jgi:hypothetical protein